MIRHLGHGFIYSIDRKETLKIVVFSHHPDDLISLIQLMGTNGNFTLW